MLVHFIICSPMRPTDLQSDAADQRKVGWPQQPGVVTAAQSGPTEGPAAWRFTATRPAAKTVDRIRTQSQLGAETRQIRRFLHRSGSTPYHPVSLRVPRAEIALATTRPRACVIQAAPRVPPELGAREADRWRPRLGRAQAPRRTSVDGHRLHRVGPGDRHAQVAAESRTSTTSVRRARATSPTSRRLPARPTPPGSRSRPSVPHR